MLMVHCGDVGARVCVTHRADLVLMGSLCSAECPIVHMGHRSVRRDAPLRSIDGDAMSTAPVLTAREAGDCRALARLARDADGDFLAVETDLSTKIGA